MTCDGQAAVLEFNHRWGPIRIDTGTHFTLIHHLCCLSHQIPVSRTHCGPCISEFFASHPGGAGDGDGGSPDLERSNVPAGSDQMGLSTDIWLTSFLHVKVYHGSGSVDSPRPPGSLCSGRRPWGKSRKNNLDSLNGSSLYLGFRDCGFNQKRCFSVGGWNLTVRLWAGNENNVCFCCNINS